MPFDKISELPEQVDDLPEHAKEIWMEAYNSAHEHSTSSRNKDKTAAQVAWSAVKNEYHKDDDSGEWVKDDSASEDSEDGDE
jgi:cation transport regulator